MGVTDTLDVAPHVRRTLEALLKQYLCGMTVWAYGSRVKGNARPNSDLDLVVFTSPQQKRQVEELREALDESDLPLRVDLSVWGEIPKHFQHEIKEAYMPLQGNRSEQDGG